MRSRINLLTILKRLATTLSRFAVAVSTPICRLKARWELSERANILLSATTTTARRKGVARPTPNGVQNARDLSDRSENGDLAERIAKEAAAARRVYRQFWADCQIHCSRHSRRELKFIRDGQQRTRKASTIAQPPTAGAR